MNREPRTLYYVPIIHTSADMGSLAKTLIACGISQLGETMWREHINTVQKFWDVIARTMASLPAAGLKIYQDGLVADGDIGLKIIAAGVQSGSRNYEIVESLIKRGAEIVKTENFSLVLEERDRLIEMIEAPTRTARIMASLHYRLMSRRLLCRRDAFMARRIEDTLEAGGRGVLFIGAYHRVRKHLRKNIRVIEVKEASKIRHYHELLPVAVQQRVKFMELSRYLEAPVEPLALAEPDKRPAESAVMSGRIMGQFPAGAGQGAVASAFPEIIEGERT